MNEINKEERMQGLSGQQVSESKAKYGTNELAKKETESLWSMFIGAFDDIWIKVLCAALALKVILAVLGIFVPALSGGNDVVEIISIVIAIDLLPVSVPCQSTEIPQEVRRFRKNTARPMPKL